MSPEFTQPVQDDSAAATSAEPTFVEPSQPAPADTAEPNLDELWAKVNAPPEQTEQQTQTAPEDKSEPPEPEDEPVQSDLTESDEADLLAEFEPEGLPSEDRLNELLKRSPDASKVEIRKAIELARANDGVVEKLGGSTAIPVYEALGKSLFTPEVTNESVENFLDQVFAVNPQLVSSATVEMVNAVWNEPSWQPMFEQKLQERFGEGFDSQKLADLVRLSSSGFLESEDVKFLLEEQGLDGNSLKNPHVQKLEQRLEEYERAEKQKTTDEASRRTQQDEYFSKANKLSDEYIMQSVEESIAPIVEKIGWTRSDKDPEQWATAKDTFSDMRSAWLEKQINSSVEAQNIKHLVKNNQAFDNNGQPTAAYRMQLEKLEGKAKGYLIRAAKVLQPTFAKSLSMTRNAVQTQPVNPPQVVQAPLVQPPVPAPNQFTAPPRYKSQEELDALYRKGIAEQAQQFEMQQRMANGR